MPIDKEHLVRFILLGNSGVGKTSLLYRFCDERFHSLGITTVGVDFKWKDIEVDGDVKRVQVWDTGGQEQFRAISKPYYRNADGALLVFDVLQPQSLLDLENYLKDARDLCPLGVAIALIGNKADLRPRTGNCVSSAEGEKFARRHGIPLYFETSAATGLCVEEAFAVLCQHAVNTRQTQQQLRVLSQTFDTPVSSSRTTWRQSSSSRRSVERASSTQSGSPHLPRPTNNFQPKKTETAKSTCCK